MVGRVHYWKGQSYFLKIAASLSAKYPNARFIMVGDAFPGYEYLYKELEAIKTEFQLQDKVYDLGYRKDISYILNSLDIFVLPSVLPDPFPTVILEAMSLGKPVVATAHGGALEMVADQQTAVIIPVNEPEIAAELIGPLISDSSTRNQLGEAGRIRLQEKFSLAAFEDR